VTTRRYIPEDSKLHTRRRENLKSHISTEVFIFLVKYLDYNAQSKAKEMLLMTTAVMTTTTTTTHTKMPLLRPNNI
jgi:hypothetical protein